MVYKRRKMYESQKKDYIERGDITQTKSYKRPKLTHSQQKELYEKGSITITIKTKVKIRKGPQADKQVNKINKDHDTFMKNVKENHERNLTKDQKTQTLTYIRYGFVRIYPDGTSDPNNLQGYQLYPGHPNYKDIIASHIPPYIIHDNTLWQGGFVIKTFINIKKNDGLYDILDEYEYQQ